MTKRRKRWVRVSDKKACADLTCSVAARLGSSALTMLIMGREKSLGAIVGVVRAAREERLERGSGSGST